MGRGGTVSRARWAYGLGADALMALGWVPLFFVAHGIAQGRGPAADHRLTVLVAATLLFSLVHQPLTLGLVYLDPDQRARQQPAATVVPIAAVLVIGTLLATGLWWLAVPIAAGWNVMHTVHQRYGLLRVYARKAGGYGVPRLDRALLYATLAAAVTIGVASGAIARQLGRIDLDTTIHDGVAALTRWQGPAKVLVIPAVAVAVWLVVQVAQTEKAAQDKGNPARWLYLTSVIALAVAIAIDPVAGFVAYVAGHSLEYFVVVDRTIHARPPARGPLHWLAAGRYRPMAALLLIAAVLAASLRWLEYSVDAVPYNTLVFTFGVLHFWLDGRIWKLRKPAVAATFGIATGATGATGATATGRPPSLGASRPA